MLRWVGGSPSSTFRTKSTDLDQRFPEATVHGADLANSAEARVAKALTEHGRIDALLNVAGGFSMQSAIEATPDDLKAQLGINLLTLFNATAVLPHMPERGFRVHPQHPSRISPEWWRMSVYGAVQGTVASHLRSVRALALHAV